MNTDYLSPYLPEPGFVYSIDPTEFENLYCLDGKESQFYIWNGYFHSIFVGLCKHYSSEDLAKEFNLYFKAEDFEEGPNNYLAISPSDTLTQLDYLIGNQVQLASDERLDQHSKICLKDLREFIAMHKNVQLYFSDY